MERAFISLITGKAWDLPKAPQRLKAFRTVLNVWRFGLTFCSAICFKRSYKTHADWCRSYLRTQVHDKTTVTYHYQLPFLIVLLLHFWGGCDQRVEDVHISYSSRTFKIFSSGTAHLENITLSVKNTLTCQPVVQQVSVSAERSGISAVLSNQTHTVIFWHQTRKEKKFPHSLPSPCLGSERCMNACSAPTAAQRFARRYYSLWGKTRQSFLYDMNIITLYCYADIPRVIVLE